LSLSLVTTYTTTLNIKRQATNKANKNEQQSRRSKNNHGRRNDGSHSHRGTNGNVGGSRPHGGASIDHYQNGMPISLFLDMFTHPSSSLTFFTTNLTGIDQL
jgi:hypothetical protein